MMIHMTDVRQSLQLYLVTDEAACLGRDFYWVVEEAVAGGVTMVQLREKSLSTRAFIDRARRLKALLEPYNVPLIINDRIDVALAVDADGGSEVVIDLNFAETAAPGRFGTAGVISGCHSEIFSGI